MALPRCSTPRTPSTAGAAAPPTSYDADLPRPPRPLSLPRLRPERARRRRSPPSGSRCDGTRGAALPAAHPGRRAPTVELPLPGLYNVYNALAAAALCLALGVAARRRSSPGWQRSRPPSGAPRRSRSASAELSILLIKNPAGANEILRTLALEAGELELLAILNDRTADGRDVSWVWDADFELLAGARAQRHLRRAPAPPSWLCG